MPPPTPAVVSAALRRLARPAGTFDARRYFRGDARLRFHNVGASQVRALARDLYEANRGSWTLDEVMGLADALVRDPYLETKAIGIELVARYRRAFTPALLPQWKRWLARDLAANWATTDAICGSLIGPLLADRPELVALMRTWARHRNPWVRRASAVALLPAIRRGHALDTAYDVATTLRSDGADLIQKAAGWLLREVGKRDAARLERYLRAGGAAIPRTTLRYAIERFPAARRQRILAATRRSSLGS
jgi:3-methyladenine DNA glycosylase AlkD